MAAVVYATRSANSGASSTGSGLVVPISFRFHSLPSASITMAAVLFVSPRTILGTVIVFHRGIYVTGKDPCVDPFCVWGNEIFMNQHQVRKLIKVVNKMGQNMEMKLFLYTLSKTTVNCRMWFSKQFTQDYLSNYMIGGRANVKVYLPGHDDYLDVLIKIEKDGRSAITRSCPRVVRAFYTEEDLIWAFRFTLYSYQNVFCLFLYRI